MFDQSDIVKIIEILLDISIRDYRNESIRRIIEPYLVIMILAYDDAFKNWVDNKTRTLDFNANVKIKDALGVATHVGYLPTAFDDLKGKDVELHRDISKRLGKSQTTPL